MKVKKIKKQYNKLLKQQAAKSFNSIKQLNLENNLKQIEINANKLVNIIYMYHRTNKKILFIGFPVNFNKILKRTKHLTIPESMWFNGMISNKSLENMKTSEKAKMHRNTFKTLLNLANKFDLLVVCDLNKTNTAVEESLKNKIPVISIKTSCYGLDIQPPYKFLDEYNLTNENKKSTNFILFLIKTGLKRAKKLKTVETYQNLKKLKNFYKPHLSKKNNKTRKRKTK